METPATEFSTPERMSDGLRHKKMLHFLKQHSPEGIFANCESESFNLLQHHFDAQVETNWAAVKQAFKVREAGKEQERKAAEALKLAERMRNEALPKTNVTEDGGVIKQVDVEGNGGYPQSGQHVKAHYNGTLTDGTPFDR